MGVAPSPMDMPAANGNGKTMMGRHAASQKPDPISRHAGWFLLALVSAAAIDGVGVGDDDDDDA